jgi:hypothetical protein
MVKDTVTMWTTLLLFLFGASAVSAGAVISACVLSGRIECDQAGMSSGREGDYDEADAYDAGANDAPASRSAAGVSVPFPQWRFN